MNLFIVGLLAHAGHGMTSSESPLHLLEPIHAVGIVAVVLLAVVGRIAYQRWHVSKRKVAQISRSDQTK